MVLSTFAWNMTNGAGHGVTIAKPENNSVYNNLYNKARVTTEKTALTFDFTIDNHDGYLIKYDAWIDGVADTKLNDPNWDPSLVLAHYVIPYDAQQFLDNYGQGAHTFTVAIYHGTPYVRPPFGLQEGDNPDDDDIYWVDNHGYLLSLVDEVSVTFTFDPVVVHLVGFWLYEEDKSYSHIVDIMPFKDLLWSENAHFLHGYSYTTGFWKPEDPRAIYQNYLSPQEDSNDIDIFMFSSHGTKQLGIHAMETTNISSYADPNDSTAEYFGKWLKRTSLKSAINSAHLDSSTILLIIDCCYAEMFNDAFTDNNNIILLASSKEDEESWGHPTYYDASYSLYKKLENIDCYFLRALALAIYDHHGLAEAFSLLASYDKSGHISCSGDQHPVSLHLDTLNEEIILYV